MCPYCKKLTFREYLKRRSHREIFYHYCPDCRMLYVEKGGDDLHGILFSFFTAFLLTNVLEDILHWSLVVLVFLLILCGGSLLGLYIHFLNIHYEKIPILEKRDGEQNTSN